MLISNKVMTFWVANPVLAPSAKGSGIDIQSFLLLPGADRRYWRAMPSNKLAIGNTFYPARYRTGELIICL